MNGGIILSTACVAGLLMSAANQPEPSLRDKVRKCFTDTEMEHDDDLMLFDIEQTITNLVAFFQADKEIAVREALGRVPQKAKQILETEYSDGLNTDMTGHGAWDIATFASRDILNELTHPQAGEGEGK